MFTTGSCAGGGEEKGDTRKRTRSGGGREPVQRHRTQTLGHEKTIEVGDLSARHLGEYVSLYTTSVSASSTLESVTHRTDGTSVLRFADQTGGEDGVEVHSSAIASIQHYATVYVTRVCPTDRTEWAYPDGTKCPTCGAFGAVKTYDEEN